jgi:predicted component of type VI protein secretion system
MQAQLIPLNGGKPIDIVSDITLVGRKRGLCDLIIDRGSVSKLHCLIVKTDGLLFIRDLGSTNGTKVNGQRVTRGALLPNDELAFAGAKYRVHLGPGEPQVGHHEHTEMLESSDGSFGEYQADDRPSNYDYSDEGEDARFFEDQPDSESDVRLLSDDSLD